MTPHVATAWIGLASTYDAIIGVAADTHSTRFGGWFQPWVLILLVVLPTAALLIYRRRDIARFFRAQDWKRRARDE